MGKGETVPDQFGHKPLCRRDLEESGHEILAGHELLAVPDTRFWHRT